MNSCFPWSPFLITFELRPLRDRDSDFGFWKEPVFLVVGEGWLVEDLEGGEL